MQEMSSLSLDTGVQHFQGRFYMQEVKERKEMVYRSGTLVVAWRRPLESKSIERIQHLCYFQQTNCREDRENLWPIFFSLRHCPLCVAQLDGTIVQGEERFKIFCRDSLLLPFDGMAYQDLELIDGMERKTMVINHCLIQAGLVVCYWHRHYDSTLKR
jgi:hypothetical protein